MKNCDIPLKFCLINCIIINNNGNIIIIKEFNFTVQYFCQFIQIKALHKSYILLIITLKNQ